MQEYFKKPQEYLSQLWSCRSGHSPSAKAWLISLAAIPGAWLGHELALELPDMVFRSYLSLIMLALLLQILEDEGRLDEAAQRLEAACAASASEPDRCYALSWR